MSSFGRLSPNDPSSFSRPDLVRINHVDIHWYLHFDEKYIDGHVMLAVEKVNLDATELLLDSYSLEISSVLFQVKDSEKVLSFTVGESIPEIGEKVTIILPENCPKNFNIRIDYATKSNASGLQWLTAEQTGTKSYPFMFSQFQSIQARSAIPCQDTPCLKATYEASVRTSINVVVLMSAQRKGSVPVSDGTNVFKFFQPVPIPAYLIAIAAGELEERKVGERSSVWAEKHMIEKAAYEFAEVDKMIMAAEGLCGKYVWGTYDMLILPQCFPYGGMENPNLTFVTPTILAGDRSLVGVIIHEITHSWTGNLVTNNNWEHFWLNEGFTMFIERKIIGILDGAPSRNLDAALGWKSLQSCVKILEKSDASTCLVPDLTGYDPESNYTLIPYEKGHAFLWYMESLFGEEEMNNFLKYYLQYFAPKAIDSNDFKETFCEFFSESKVQLQSIDWDTWLYKPGMPPVDLKFDTSLMDSCTNLLQKWLDWGVNSECQFNKQDIQQFSPSQFILWLTMISELDSLPIEKLKKMEEVYELSCYKNSDIRFNWIITGLKSRWKKAIQPAVDFINEQGRMKYIVPIYREMYKWSDTRPTALENYEKQKKTMMHCSVQKVGKELNCLK